VYLREVFLPMEKPGFLMIKDKSGDKWRANMIILGERFDLSNADIVKLFMERGADVCADHDHFLRYSASRGNLNIVKLLIEKGANIHADNDYALRWSARNGHLDVVKLLIEKGADIHADNEYVFRNGHPDVYDFLKYL